MVATHQNQRITRWSLAALVAVLALVLPWTSAQAQTPATGEIGAEAAEGEVVTTTTRSYVLGSATRGDEHTFDVTFDSEGNVVSTSGGGSEEVLIGTEQARQAALATLASLQDQGIDKLVINAEEPASTTAPGWTVVNQTASPTAQTLPDPSTYDAVVSAPGDDSRALLFFSEGELTEARTYDSAASGLSQVKVTIEIDCEITWDSENGFQLHCTIRVKIGPFTVLEEEIVFPSE